MVDGQVDSSSKVAAASTPDSDKPRESLEARLAELESDLKSLKGKGFVLAIVAALLGSGGATAIATTYLSARTVKLQEHIATVQDLQAKSDIAQKALQNKQIEVETQLKQQQLATERVKADQASFEARMQAYSSAVKRLQKEELAAKKAGDTVKAAKIAESANQEVSAFRSFIALQKRYVQENPNVPGWYRQGIEQAESLCGQLFNNQK
jgi:DNA repair exonuclease SbcCD ATPase subunit